VTSILADCSQPVASGLRHVQERSDLIAVVLDTSFKEDLSHIVQIRALRPDILIAVNTAHLPEEKKRRALHAGADYCFRKGDLPEWFYQKAVARFHRVHDAYLAAERRFRSDLQELLQDPSKMGRWVAYTPGGLFDVGDHDLTLVRSCEGKGLQPGQFVVARVMPELPPDELGGGA
jgi:hypothetical protein